MANVECIGPVDAFREALTEWSNVVESWKLLQSHGESAESPWVDLAGSQVRHLWEAWEAVEVRAKRCDCFACETRGQA